jgi:PAT family beta-lactamase induction signal transducer AmpG
MVAGYLSETLGYTRFFIVVCLCTLPGILAAFKIQQILPEGFGKENK